MAIQDTTPLAPPSLDALAAVRACAGLAIQADALELGEAADRALEVLRAYVGKAHGALAIAYNPAEGGGAAHVLARQGIADEDVAAVLVLLSVRADAHKMGAEETTLPGWIAIGQPLDMSAGASTQRVLVLLRRSAAASDNPHTRESGPDTVLDPSEAALAAVLEATSAALVTSLRAEAARTRVARARFEEEALKAELLGTVSHELRSPLTAIRGYAASLLKHEQRLSRAERHEFLRAIETASNQLDDVIERLLDMSRLAAGTIQMERESLDLVALAREALQMAGQHVRASSSAVSLRLLAPSGAQPALPLVEGDARWLSTVLRHLLENAIKFTPQGGVVEVMLRAAPVSIVELARQRALLPVVDQREPRFAESTMAAPTPSMVEIQVRDAGPGIPAEHLSRVFDRFHRVDTELTRAGDGLGLGLSICQRVTELHGGAIWAESERGQGSTFHVLLPAAAATSER